MKVTGEVFTGEGEAADFLQLKPYRDFIARKLEKPFPGTLNLRVNPTKARKLKQEAEFHRLEGFTYRGEDYGGVNLYIVKVKGEVVGVVEPDRTRYDDAVVELVAEKELRKALSLTDGDALEIEPFKH